MLIAAIFIIDPFLCLWLNLKHVIANRIDYVRIIVDRGMVKVLGSSNATAMQHAVRLVVVEMRLRGRREVEFAVHIEIRIVLDGIHVCGRRGRECADCRPIVVEPFGEVMR